MAGYASYFTPSKSSKGGCGIYVNYDRFESADLKVCTVDFQATYVGIKNKKSKNHRVWMCS